MFVSSKTTLIALLCTIANTAALRGGRSLVEEDPFVKYNGACRTMDGGPGIDGEDYERYTDVNLQFCKDECLDNNSCLAFEYKSATSTSKSHCEIWFTYPENQEVVKSFSCYRKPTISLKITNLSFQQPFSSFFVMVHDATVGPIFTLGEKSSNALALLAENGDPGPLVKKYKNQMGVHYIGTQNTGAPYFGGETMYIRIPYIPDSYVTIASMAINTNDCFVALNSVPFPTSSDVVFTGPGYDSGSETNNEDCKSIPGPACPPNSGNIRSGDGEGFVHVHRGFFGIGPSGLTAKGYDWRNPMLRVNVDGEFSMD